MKAARPVVLVLASVAVLMVGAVTFGWFYEKSDIDRRQADAEARFEESLSKWQAEEDAKTAAASPQPAE